MKDGHIITSFGRCYWSLQEGYVHIYDLFVKNERRGRGLAKYLLQQAINGIREAGHTKEICIVADPMESSIDRVRLSSFYKKMGLDVYEYYG